MESKYDIYPLAQKVLAVAVMNYTEDGKFFDWAAYVDAVPGQNHSDEYKEVARVGAKLPKKLAFTMFPNFPEHKWRD